MGMIYFSEDYIEDIADAIRARNGQQTEYMVVEMPAAIASLPNEYTQSDEGKVVSNGALVAQTALTVTQNGTVDTTANNSVTVNVAGGGGSSVTDVTRLFLAGGDSDLVLLCSKNVKGYLASQSVGAFYRSKGYHNYTRYSGYYNSDTPAITSFDLTESILLESTQDFKERFPVLTSTEYYGNIYGNSTLINTYGLVLLCDASQGGNSTITLSDSIENYSAILLQGIYQRQRTSDYNTTKLYTPSALSTTLWSGMKDRNDTYDCWVAFTSNTTATLTGNKQVIVYGLP